MQVTLSSSAPALANRVFIELALCTGAVYYPLINMKVFACIIILKMFRYSFEVKIHMNGDSLVT